MLAVNDGYLTRVTVSKNINLELKKNFPITKAGKATLAPVDTIIFGFSFIKIRRISIKLNISFVVYYI